MAKVYETGETPKLGVSYNITKTHPFDVREIVPSFEDLLDPIGSFRGNVYEDMRVLVADECCVYMLISRPNQPDDKRFGKIINQFEYALEEGEVVDLEANKDLWKRLTIETITTKEALERAQGNLVNGALIYVANDIVSEDTTTKAGFYYCKSGEDLKTVGGEVTAEQFTTLNNKVDVDDKVSTAIKAAIAALVDEAPEELNTLRELSAALQNNPDVIATLNEAIGTKANQSSLTELSAEVSRIDEVAGAASASIDDLEASLGDYTDKAKIDEAIATSKTEITDAYTQAIMGAINTHILNVINNTEF